MSLNNGNVPVLRLNLPRALTKKTHTDSYTNMMLIQLRVCDLKLSWREFFRKQETLRCQNLYQQMMKVKYPNRLEIVDQRLKSVRRTWTLENTVEQFINSFKINKSVYIASMKIVQGIMRNESEIMMPSNDVRPGPSSGYASDKPFVSQSGRRLKMLPTPPPPFQRPRIHIPYGDDDASSMASSTCTNESVSDPYSDGVVDKFVKYSSQNTLKKISDELKALRKRERKYLHISNQLPVLFNFLSVVFDECRS